MGTKFNFSSHSLETTEIASRARLRLLRPADFFIAENTQPGTRWFSFLQHKLLCCPLDFPEIIFVDEVSFSFSGFSSFESKPHSNQSFEFDLSILCSLVTKPKFSCSCLMTQS